MTFIEKRYPEWVKKYGVEMADRLRQKSAFELLPKLRSRYERREP